MSICLGGWAAGKAASFPFFFVLLWPMAKARQANALFACSHIAGRRLAGCKDNDNHQAAAQECAMGIDTWCGGFHGTLHCNVSQIAQKDDTNHGIYKYYAYLCSGFPLRRNPRHDIEKEAFLLCPLSEIRQNFPEGESRHKTPRLVVYPLPTREYRYSIKAWEWTVCFWKGVWRCLG